ncbi:serine hydrolase domain-containing protein [Microvirga rosea]|uniref:serine hydrolase domain-containing protein n=1 Tax=Microvirga rosea TaxID=2715425 RepID=UPI001D0AE861|nr:serine hydrolase domain-containing protein [Microvirga rosea]MCB8822124.1 beta-lactamase family protein [Microvirga rosea]
MDAWLDAALSYISSWLPFQLRTLDQPGCAVAITFQEKLVYEAAFGVADLSTGEKLTPRHMFRVASHSKTFTASAILKLREMGHVRLDDPVGRYVKGLHPRVAEATLEQLLSHSAGLTRDGRDSGQFMDRRPYLSAEELRADLGNTQPLEPGEAFKYSNHGYGLLGLVVEAITGEPYAAWVQREVLEPAGLPAIAPDTPFIGNRVLARGHSAPLPLGRRVVIAGDAPANAIAPAGGFVASASDLVRFFAQLSPKAETSILTVASRRDMIRRRWRDEGGVQERHYGLGTLMGPPGEWASFGHSGSLQGFLSRTAVYVPHGVAITVLANAIDAPAALWVEGIAHILKTYSQKGAPADDIADWRGRWWSIWGATDLVPLGKRVVTATPYSFWPFADGSEAEMSDCDNGLIVHGSGFNSIREPLRRVRDAEGRVCEVWVGGSRLVEEEALRDEMVSRYTSRGRRTASDPSPGSSDQG